MVLRLFLLCLGDHVVPGFGPWNFCMLSVAFQPLAMPSWPRTHILERVKGERGPGDRTGGFMVSLCVGANSCLHLKPWLPPLAQGGCSVHPERVL